jgi:hypothetical protein
MRTNNKTKWTDGMDYLNASNIRRLTDSLMVYPSGDFYVGYDLIGKLDADVMFALAYGLDSLYRESPPKITKKNLKSYLKKRGLPDTENVNIVDERKSCHDDLELNVRVKGLSLQPRRITEKMPPTKSWEDGTYYNVDVLNIGTDEGGEHDLFFLCGCPRYFNGILCRSPADQRRSFGDYRNRTSRPAPYTMHLHDHVGVALNYGAIFLETDPMKIWGYPEEAVQIEKHLLDYMKRIPIGRWPQYRLNNAFNKDFGKALFNPVIMEVRKRIV